MTLVVCPGCGETYESEERITVADFRPVGLDLVTPMSTEHYTAPDGTRYCCDECFVENGGKTA